jgi:hypothetical protein
MFSGLIAVSLYHYGTQKEKDERITFVKNYYKQPISKISSIYTELQDTLLKGNLFSTLAQINPSTSNPDSIVLKNINISIDSFTTNIELYNQEGLSVLNTSKYNYTYLNTLLSLSQRIDRNLYYHPLKNKYLLQFEIARADISQVWHLYIVSSGRKLPINQYENINHSYAVFNQSRLIDKSTSYLSMSEQAIMRAQDSAI